MTKKQKMSCYPLYPPKTNMYFPHITHVCWLRPGGFVLRGYNSTSCEIIQHFNIDEKWRKVKTKNWRSNVMGREWCAWRMREKKSFVCLLNELPFSSVPIKNKSVVVVLIRTTNTCTPSKQNQFVTNCNTTVIRSTSQTKQNKPSKIN
jgi:hypothetical protein